MRKFIYIVYTLMVAVILTGCGADKFMKKGDKFYSLGEYYDAATQYKRAYSATPAKERATRGKRAKKLADCYRRINHAPKAIAAYNNVVRYKQEDSLTHFYLGQLYLRNGNYHDAERHFQLVLDSAKGKLKEPYLSLTKAGLKSAQQGPNWKKEGSKYTVKRMDIFNSRRADFSPMFAGDDNDQLYFTSTRSQTKGDELSGITGTKTSDIFFSQKDDKGKWGKPQTIDSELNTALDEGVCSFSPDNRTMYLTQCPEHPDYPRYATICTSNRSDAAWSKATQLIISKDTTVSYAHPAISPDGEWIYFVSDMPGGMGGYDIWRASLYGNNVGPMENLGAPVNTPGDEMFPTFRPNGDLYFSSNGHPGLGGLDIFIAKPIDKSKIKGQIKKAPRWELEHPGYPLNSQGDDFGMTFEGGKNSGFFSSNRGDGKGWDHIYSFEKPEVIQTVKGWVYELEGYELPAAIVYMVGNDGTNLKINVKGDGSFTQVISPNVDYIFLATCKGFLNHREQLRVAPVTDSEEYVLQFPLASLTAPVLIDNIFYDFDKATLRPESKTALDELVDLLKENPNVAIELSAHADYRGSNAYNKTLAQRRAEAVVGYLIEHGIEKGRLTPVGYGKEKPKTIRRKLTETYPFLKENDVLTEEFIHKLSPEEQEICNQLNRRTEFIVTNTTYNMFDENGQLKNPPKPRKIEEREEYEPEDLW